MSSAKKLILDEERVRQIVRRIAFQIRENNMNSSNLTLVGICDLGFELAGNIIKELSAIDPKLTFEHLRVDLDKTKPRGTVQLDQDVKNLSGKSIILVDDVLNTGRTLAYSLLALLSADLEKIEVAVLVDRGHPQYPVAATFTGYQLSTTLEEHIEVNLGNKPSVYLY